MFSFRAAAVAVVALCMCALSPTSSSAQSSRDLALQHVQLGEGYERGGQLRDAMGEFESVFYDMDDDDHEFQDVKARAGVDLGMVLLKLDQRDAAIKAFRAVAKMKDAPDNWKDFATTALKKLGESVDEPSGGGPLGVGASTL